MNKFYTIFAIALLSILSLSFNSAQAQTVEGDPTYDLVFTPYYPENYAAMPLDVRQATQPAISASPNPVSSETLKVWYNALMGTSQLDVFDVKGQVVHSATVGNDRERAGLHEFSVSGMLPGMYMVRLTSGAYKTVQKIILR